MDDLDGELGPVDQVGGARSARLRGAGGRKVDLMWRTRLLLLKRKVV